MLFAHETSLELISELPTKRQLVEMCIDPDRVQDIVREAGMSSRSFYELFENKEELVIGLAMQRGDEFLGRLESAVAESDNVLEAVERMVTSFLDDLPWVMLDLERISGTMSSRVREIRDVYRAKIADVLMRQIQFVVKAGLIAPEDAPAPMSLLLLGQPCPFLLDCG